MYGMDTDGDGMVTFEELQEYEKVKATQAPGAQRVNMGRCMSGDKACMTSVGSQTKNIQNAKDEDERRTRETELKLAKMDVPNKTVTDHVYLDLAITRPPFDPGPNLDLGRVTIALFGAYSPKSVKNFM